MWDKGCVKMYCQSCNRIVHAEKCPFCGTRDLRLPRFDDFCFLTEPEPLWVRAMEDILTDNGIEYRTRSLRGAGIVAKTGIPQRTRFFVRYQDLAQAKELEQAFFSGDFIFEE